MNETVFSWQHFNKCAEFFDRNHPSMIALTDFDFLGHSRNDLFRPVQAIATGRIDVNGSIIIDINLRAGFSYDAFDRLAAGTDEQTDLIRMNLNRFNARRVLTEFFPWRLNRFVHDIEHLHAGVARLTNGVGHDRVRDSWKF